MGLFIYMIIAFTGHRPEKCGGFGESKEQDSIRYQLSQALQIIKPQYTISGMALGVDQWAFEECVRLKIPVLAAIPFEGQEKVWPVAGQKKYRSLLDKAFNVVVVNKEQGYESKTVFEAMQRRNEYLVDHCHILIGVHDGSRGGTYNCIEYAKLIKRPTFIINKWS